VVHRHPLQHLEDELAELRRRGLYRDPPEPLPAGALSFCSNDYLGLAQDFGGAGASRLIAGERGEHRELERTITEWLGCEASLAFTSGYAANVGVLSALARSGDLVVSDALNHASLIDGARLSRARIAVVPHLDIGAVEHALRERQEARAWVVVESYFSMDADGPDLARYRAACDANGAALVVDEAHALGVLGPGGRGRCAEAEVTPDVLVGTLGKAFGGQGAFVAGSTLLRRWLWNRARSFVFSTGLAPSCAAAATRAIDHLRARPDLPARVLDLASRLRSRLAAGGVVAGGFGHVVPIVIGTPDRALAIAERLRADGISVQAVRPPTVPEGTSRIRVTVTAAHRVEDIDRAAAALIRTLAV